MKTINILFRATPDQREKLEEAAKREGLVLSEAMRRVLYRWARIPLAEATRRAGRPRKEQ